MVSVMMRRPIPRVYKEPPMPATFPRTCTLGDLQSGNFMVIDRAIEYQPLLEGKKS